MRKILYILFLCVTIIPLKAQFAEYSDQKITVTNVDIRKNESRSGVKGIQLTCYAFFMYGEDKIRGAFNSAYLKSYFFYLEIKRKDNGDRIFFPYANPDMETGEKTFDEYYRVTIENSGKYHVRIFIPYHQFQLIPGFHNVELSLHACDEKAIYTFKDLYKTDLQIEQPKTYLARLNVKYLKLIDQKYDQPATKIPFLGLFAGGSKSKAGKGLPDPSWRVMVGNDLVFLSQTNRNSLEALPGAVTFKVSEGDPVKFFISDDEFFKKEEDLGSINYYINQFANNKDEKINYKFGTVENSHIIFETTPVPSISNTILDYEITKYDEVTGIKISITYLMEGLQENRAIVPKPLFKLKNGSTYTPDYVKFVDINLELSENGNMVDRRNGADRQIFFIPHYAIKPNSFPGIEFIMDDFNKSIYSFFSKKIVNEIEVKNDVSYLLGKPQEDDYRGYWGMKFPIVLNIPMDYYNHLHFEDVENHVRIFLDGKNEITNKVKLVSMFNDTALGKFSMRKIRNDKIVHIPYSELNLSNESHQLIVYTNSICKINSKSISADTFYIALPNPSLINIVPFDFHFKVSDRYIFKALVNIYRGETLLKSFPISTKELNKKIKLNVDISEHKFHEKDELRLEIVGFDEFGKEKILDKEIVTPQRINFNLLPDHKRKKGIKGFLIRRSKI